MKSLFFAHLRRALCTASSRAGMKIRNWILHIKPGDPDKIETGK